MSDLPKSTHFGELTICGVTLRCHRLDDGRSVIEQEGVEQLFEAFANGADLSEDDSAALARFVRGETA